MFETRFQSFTRSGDKTQSAARLAALRAALAERGLVGFLVPRADEHQNEYTPPSAERLAWLTGFSGSAGLAIVLADKAALFIDGRYTIAAKDEVDATQFATLDSADSGAERWLESQAPRDGRVGYDPWLMTPAQVARFQRAAEAAGAALVPVDNPLDAVWTDRPAPPHGALNPHPARYAGEAAAAKLARAQSSLKGADALLLSDPHAVAWLFNLRGGDVSHTPIALLFALVPKQGRAVLYVDAERMGALTQALAEVAEVRPPARLVADLDGLGRDHATVLFDAASAPARLSQTVEAAGGKALIGADPIALMKARKNAAELKGTRAAHRRDGAALTRFLAWFDAEALKGKLTEIDATAALETFRRDTGKLRDVSFPTIAGFGPHAAMPHYRVTEATNIKIGKGLFLVDSGAQYEDGTTDVTRTIAIGRPTALMRDRFTRVLKGHIAIAASVFPKGTSGAQIDGFARRSLWEAGLDFDHGVGHGVGAYLSVHEGPQRISKLGSVALERGMILSNEPGYYAAGLWGIRIENLIVVEERKVIGGERPMLGFETITFAPIDRTLVDLKLMSAQEIAWLDAYHARVRRELSDLLDAPTRRWLAQATRRLRA